MKALNKIFKQGRGKALLSFVLLFFISIGVYGVSNPLNLRRACKAQNDSDIVLKWNIPADTCGSFQAYYIYGRSITTALFDTIDSVTVLNQNQYIHKGAFLVANTWKYFVVVHYDCGGNPTISSDTLSIDLTQTADQYIDSVSVDQATGKYIIGWKTNTSPDISGYKLYTVSGANNIILKDLDNTFNQYLDINSNSASIPITYSIAAYDSCNNITAIIDKHTPIRLSVSFDSCSHSFTLNWSGYVGFPLSKYEIIASINGNPFYTMRDFLNVSGPLTFVLNDTAFHDGDNVCFLIRARNANNAGVSSTSNQICLPVKFISLNQVNYISQVNVVDPTTIKVDWVTDHASYISVALFQQSDDGVNFFTREAFIPSFNTVSFLLDSVQTDINKYYFRVLTYNTCQQLHDTSNICNSILLKANKFGKGFNRLTWSDYLDFDAGVERYDIYQGTGDPTVGHAFNLLATVLVDSLAYTDGTFPDVILNDGVCYYVVAYENTGNAYGVNLASCKSNEVCVPGEMIVFFPTAFNPNSNADKNILFTPRGLYIDYSKSWMKIYNRWGQLVFETNDLLKGWDGKDDGGIKLPSDEYICTSYISALKGKNQYYKGLVYLVR